MKRSLFPNKVDQAKEKAQHERNLLLADIDYELTNLFHAMEKKDKLEQLKAKNRLKELHKEISWRDFYNK